MKAIDKIINEMTEEVLKEAQFINPFPGLTPGKKLSDTELIRAIRQALAAEEEATHLYDAIADATDNKLVAEVMRDVAKEEIVHKGEFQKLLDELNPDEEDLIKDGKKEVEDMM